MKDIFGDLLDVKFHTMDSEEAKGRKFKGSTAVLLDNEPVPLDVAMDSTRMEAFLTETINR